MNNIFLLIGGGLLVVLGIGVFSPGVESSIPPTPAYDSITVSNGSLFANTASSQLMLNSSSIILNGVNNTDTILLEINDPSSGTLGGVYSQVCTAGQFMQGIDTNGNILCATP